MKAHRAHRDRVWYNNSIPDNRERGREADVDDDALEEEEEEEGGCEEATVSRCCVG